MHAHTLTHSHMGLNIFGYIPPFARPEVVKKTYTQGPWVCA